MTETQKAEIARAQAKDSEKTKDKPEIQGPHQKPAEQPGSEHK